MQLKLWLGVLLAASSLGVGQERTRLEWRTLEREGEAALRYARVLPDAWTAERVSPVLLLLPRGAQDQAAVESTLELCDAEELARRGWIVACPIAPAGETFFTGGERALTALLAHLDQSCAVEGGRVHVAGISNGGRSAFHFAALHADRVASLSALPGYPASEADFAALERLIDVPIALSVGGDDAEWLAQMQRTEARLRELGAGHLTLTVCAGEGHVPRSAVGKPWIAALEGLRALELERVASELAITAALDEFHRAAASADLERYFAALTPDAVFIGTDATERWSAEDFRAFVEPYFRRGEGWTYTSLERHVAVAPGARVAWFDERLDNQKYGEVRGSGVLRKLGSRWRIAHYVLSFAVPNEASERVVEGIRGGARGR